jgi:hypothetical protein
MTVHIALSSNAGSVMLSDSQGSTETSETHGHQKQFVGLDFLLGGAGSGFVLNSLFDALDSQDIDAISATKAVETFFRREVRTNALERAEIVAVTPGEGGKNIQHFTPGAFRRFGKRTSTNLVGSGASFAQRADLRDRAIGVSWPTGSLADLLALAFDRAYAANEALTVNDKFMVGFLKGDRAYVMGDEAIHPTHIPMKILSKWRLVSNFYKEDILPKVISILDIRYKAYRACSRLIEGESRDDVYDDIETQLASLAVNVATLRLQLTKYFARYDEWLERPPQ